MFQLSPKHGFFYSLKDGKYHKILTVFINGGDKRIRTADLLNANQALYQLSYTPTSLLNYTTLFSICK